MSLKKRDYILIAVAIIILLVLFAAPPESTTRVPYDQIHKKFYSIVQTQGKKAAEKFCENCHNAKDVPFPKDHPPKFRCLFCHKLEAKHLK